MRMALAMLILAFGPASGSLGQSSSLFLRAQARKAIERAATTRPTNNGALPANSGSIAPNTVSGNMALAQASLTAIKLPEPKVIGINDFVGVIVRYRLQHQSSAKLKQESEWDVNAKLEAWFRLHDRKWTDQGFRAGKPEINFKSENEIENKGKSDRKDTLETRVMAKVIDVKPNGNLVLVAWQTKGMNEDVQYLRLYGECNRDDITADGNILSDKIFGLDVRIMNEGDVRDAVKRGWLKELLDRVKPF